jgi:putative ABC transport system permease protein
MTTFLHDVRYAWRVLWRAPLTSGVAVLTLALGIGAASAIFAFVNATLLTPPAGVADPGRLVTIGRTYEGDGFDNSSYPNYADLRDQNRVFSDVAAVTPAPLSLSDGGRAERKQGALVTPNYFRTLGVAFARGGGFDARIASGGDPSVAVISHAAWVQQFGGDPEIVGRLVSLNGERFEIIGVTAAGFRGVDATSPQDIWAPLWTVWTLHVFPPAFRAVDVFRDREAVWVMLYARLKPGVTPDQARGDVGAIDRRLHAYPENARNGWSIAAGVGLDPGDRRDLVRLSQLLFAGVGALFLLACANVANLSLARAAARVHEVSVRLAIGATRARLVRQLLTESLLLAVCGGMLGVIVQQAASDWLSSLLAASSRLTLTVDTSPAPRVVLFAFAAAALAALLFGVAPALRSARGDLVPALKEAVAIAPRQSRLRRGLVVAQLVLSIVLLVGAGLLIRTIRAFDAVDTGVNVADVVIGTVEPAITGRYDEARLRQFYAQLLPRLRSIPGVTAAALGRIAPVTSHGFGVSARVLDKPGSFTETRGLQFNTVSSNYFDVLGMHVLRGRGFSEADTATSMPVMVINDLAASRLWPNENPIGRQILVGGEPTPRQVVGVVATIKYRNLVETSYPLAYYPLSQPVPMADAPIVIHVRSRRPVAALAAALGREVQAIDPELPVFDVKRLSDHIAQSYWRQRIVGLFTTVLAVLALALGAIGMYGVMTFAVTERTREIGVRMALGASRRQVLGMFLLDATRLIGLSIAAGIGLSLLFSRLVASLLFGVNAHDPLTYLAATVVLAGAGLLACAVPALRASRVDPMLVLRRE